MNRSPRLRVRELETRCLPSATPIQHVVIITMENHSFDSLFGTYPGANGLPTDANDFVRGAALWTSLSVDTLPGLVLSFCHVMVLVCIAITLATRLPMVLNLVLVISVFLVSHLTPTLVGKARRLQDLNPGSVVAQMLSFVSQVFDTLLPGLDFFRIDQVLVTDAPPEPGPYALYVLSVLFYALLYTVIVMLFGLVLFEDRDLA